MLKKTVVISNPERRPDYDLPQRSRPPGLIIASDKAVENGKKHLRKGHCDKAIKEFNKALEKNPDNFEALYWLGVAEGICGYYPQAYNRLSIAIRYAPNDVWRARVYATIGLVLTYMGRDMEAEFYIRKSLSLDPNNELAIYYGKEGKKHKKHKGWKKHEKGEKEKFKEDNYEFQIVLRWMD